MVLLPDFTFSENTALGVWRAASANTLTAFPTTGGAAARAIECRLGCDRMHLATLLGMKMPCVCYAANLQISLGTLIQVSAQCELGFERDGGSEYSA